MSADARLPQERQSGEDWDSYERRMMRTEIRNARRAHAWGWLALIAWVIVGLLCGYIRITFTKGTP